MAVATLSDLVFHVRDIASGRPELLSVFLGDQRETLSASDFIANVHALALALEAQGVERGDRIAIFAENRPEWPTVDFACHLLGAPTLPIFPTLAADQVGFILRNSGCRLVFYSGGERRQILTELQSSLTAAVSTVSLDAAADGSESSLTELLGRGAADRASVPLERFRGRIGQDDLASLIYTSGTTGDPKGVMLTHGNLVSNFLACGELFQVGPKDLALSVLPLSHVFQRTVDHLCLYRGVPIHYVPRLEDVGVALQEIRPTVMTALPRLFERAARRLLNDLRTGPRLRRMAANWALAVGRRYARESHGGFIGPLLALQQWLAEHLVFRRIRQRFGGRLRLAISGGAPLGHDVSEFFEAIGMPVFQGYGLTETAPVLAANAPGQHRLGSVGRIVPEVEVRLADDGEILAKGPGVMRGYWGNPEETARTVDEEGWLHTGDVGEIDKSGYLFITDRKDDLLVMSDGRTIAPQPIESLLVSHPLVAQAVVVGDGRPFPNVLLVPELEGLLTAVGVTGDGELTPEELVEHPAARRHMAQILAEVNVKLDAGDRLRRFKLLTRELTTEAGELTPTLKVRRRVVAQRYAAEIAAMYVKG